MARLTVNRAKRSQDIALASQQGECRGRPRRSALGRRGCRGQEGRRRILDNQGSGPCDHVLAERVRQRRFALRLRTYKLAAVHYIGLAERVF